MPLNKSAILARIRAFDFPGLFTQELGWDSHKANLTLPIADHRSQLRAVAEKRGMTVFVHDARNNPPETQIPAYPLRRKIERQVAKSAHEHLIIFIDAHRTTQTWQWVKRELDKPVACREHTFNVAQDGEALFQKLSTLVVTLEDDEQTTLLDITGKVKAAFDIDKVTKRFYDRFKAEHTSFMAFIKGFPPPTKKGKEQIDDPDLQWYASLMLNRLMFVYFIQKKGFLDDDQNYLRNRLQRVQQQKGKGQFLSFYRYFLLRLFHDGLGKAPAERQPDLDALLGKVPYLNGGFFQIHPLETKYTDIDIPDDAFLKLFDFFDQYHWHLDERPCRKDNEINPDVVGYIFEKYINQKQMGAYYTKEDITEYISKNTIIPYLFDAAKEKCAIAFKPGSALWRLLQEDPDKYIYAAVRHGVIDDAGQVIPLPPEIEAGIADIPRRAGWNKPAPQPYALPTETWREHVARRQRCLELRQKLAAGEVHAVNDLITLNLDLWQFARDVILNTEGIDLLGSCRFIKPTSMSVMETYRQNAGF